MDKSNGSNGSLGRGPSTIKPIGRPRFGTCGSSCRCGSSKGHLPPLSKNEIAGLLKRRSLTPEKINEIDSSIKSGQGDVISNVIKGMFAKKDSGLDIKLEILKAIFNNALATLISYAKSSECHGKSFKLDDASGFLFPRIDIDEKTIDKVIESVQPDTVSANDDGSEKYVQKNRDVIRAILSTFREEADKQNEEADRFEYYYVKSTLDDIRYAVCNKFGISTNEDEYTVKDDKNNPKTHSLSDFHIDYQNLAKAMKNYLNESSTEAVYRREYLRALFENKPLPKVPKSFKRIKLPARNTNGQFTSKSKLTQKKGRK